MVAEQGPQPLFLAIAVSMAVLFLSAIGMGIGGLGLIMRQNWGRLLTILSASLIIVFSFADVALNAVLAASGQMPDPFGLNEQLQQGGSAATVGMVIGGCIGFGLRAAYPVVALFMVMPDQFRQELEA